MIEFGKTLREAREAKGLSISQVAEMTRIMHSIVEGLENENFSKLPAPIYGRGFVKLYCEVVGLDPKPMVAEFMEIYNGNRDVAIKERPRTPAPVAEESPVVETAAISQKPDSTPEQNLESTSPQEPDEVVASEPPPEPDLFSMPAEPAPQPAVQSVPQPTVQQDKPAQSLSRYATPVRQRPEFQFSPMLGRWAALAVCASIVLILAFLGLRALYRATSPAPSDIDEATPKAAAAVIAAENREVKERTPQEIPSLYID